NEINSDVQTNAQNGSESGFAASFDDQGASDVNICGAFGGFLVNLAMTDSIIVAKFNYSLQQIDK
ncbi:MAG: hypothetical protein ACRC6G_03900, partial [Deefgea sp.]